MKCIKKAKNLMAVLALVATVCFLSSCNRGVGCPTFSIDSNVIEVVELMPNLFIHE